MDKYKNIVMGNGQVSNDPVIVGNKKSAKMRMANPCMGIMCEVAISYIVYERRGESYGHCCICFFSLVSLQLLLLNRNLLLHCYRLIATIVHTGLYL